MKASFLAHYAYRHYPACLALLPEKQRTALERGVDADAFEQPFEAFLDACGQSARATPLYGAQPTSWHSNAGQAGVRSLFSSYKPHLIIGISVLIGLIVVLASQSVPPKLKGATEPKEVAPPLVQKTGTVPDAQLVERHMPWGRLDAEQVLIRQAYILGYNPQKKLMSWLACKIGKDDGSNHKATRKDDPDIDDRDELPESTYQKRWVRCSLMPPKLVLGADRAAFQETKYFSITVPTADAVCNSLMAKLDNSIKNASTTNDVWVMKGPIYYPGGKRRIGQVAVPDAYFCIVIRENGKGEADSEAYILPNVANHKSDPQEYRSTLREVWDATGFELDMPGPRSQ